MRSTESIWAECVARSAEEDALFVQYLALADRPRPIECFRVFEASPLEPMETFDMAHWVEWYAARTTMPMPTLMPKPTLMSKHKTAEPFHFLSVHGFALLVVVLVLWGVAVKLYLLWSGAS